MSHRILIVDDDDDFRSLLADLYTQADYEVTPFANPLEALKQFKKDGYHLCVVDQTMPDLKGIDLIDQVRLINPRIPVIMISAFLGEDVIERLRQLRIDVFHKPLNVRSLLRKTAELISGSVEVGPTHASEVMNEAARRPVGDDREAFLSFPLKSELSRKFHREILTLKQDPSNLVLVGQMGTHFQLICEDIESLYPAEEHLFLYLSNDKITSFEILRMLSGEESSRSIMVVLLEAYDLQPIHRDVLLKLYRKAGPFSAIQNNVRFVFCLNEDLDAQYSKGKIDEDFYLILGQREIFVPSLGECQEDIPEMALTIAKNYARDNRQYSFRGFDTSAIDFLKGYDWVRNYAQLEATIHAAVRLSEGYPIGEPLLSQLAAQPDFIVEAPEVKPRQDVPEKARPGAESSRPMVSRPAPTSATPPAQSQRPAPSQQGPSAGQMSGKPALRPGGLPARPAGGSSPDGSPPVRRLHLPTAKEIGLNPARPVGLRPSISISKPGAAVPPNAGKPPVKGVPAPGGTVPLKVNPVAKPPQKAIPSSGGIKPGSIMSAPVQRPMVAPGDRSIPSSDVVRFPKLADETADAERILSRGKPF